MGPQFKLPCGKSKDEASLKHASNLHGVGALMPTMFFSSGMEHQMKAMLWSAKLLLLSCCCCCKTWPLGSHQHTVIATLSSASAGAADVAGPVCRHDLNSFLHHSECARSCGNCVS